MRKANRRTQVRRIARAPKRRSKTKAALKGGLLSMVSRIGKLEFKSLNSEGRRSENKSPADAGQRELPLTALDLAIRVPIRVHRHSGVAAFAVAGPTLIGVTGLKRALNMPGRNTFGRMRGDCLHAISAFAVACSARSKTRGCHRGTCG